eukprot:gene17109-26252_t
MAAPRTDSSALIFDDFQSTSSAGFWFAAVAAPVFIVASLVYLRLKGVVGNDKYLNTARRSRRCEVAVLAWRVAVTAFVLVQVFAFSFDDEWDLAFFTLWNFLILALYFVFGTAVSCMNVRMAPDEVIAVNYRRSLPNVEYTPPAAKEPTASSPSTVHRCFSVTHQVLGEVELPTAVFLSVVVWAYLAPSETFSDWTDYNSIVHHAFNSVFMVTDFLVGGYGINPHHFPVVIVLTSLYTIWHLIGNAEYGIIAYEFFKTDDDAFIPTLLGLLAGVVVAYFLMFGMSRLKQKCCACCETSTADGT